MWHSGSEPGRFPSPIDQELLITEPMQSAFIIVLIIAGLITAGDSYAAQLAAGSPLKSLTGMVYTLVLFLQISYILGLAGWLAFPGIRERIQEKARKWTSQVRTFWVVLAIGGLILYEVIQDTLFLRVEINPVNYAVYRQLIVGHFSTLIFAALLAIQAIGIMIAIHKQWIRSWLRAVNNGRWAALAGIGLIFLLGLLRSPLSFLPSPKEELGFNDLNAPLLGIQVSLAALALVGLSWLGNFISKRWKGFREFKKDFLVAFVLFLGAFFLWRSAPSTQMAFTDAPRPPNYQYYPVADPLNYEISAQRMLSGQGLGEGDHPGFRILVSVLHYLVGDGYEEALQLYLLLISLVPVFLYLMGRELGSRFGGGLAAVLMILRIHNSLLLAKYVTVINPRELMSEPVAALGLLVISYLLIQWLKGEKQRSIYLLYVGGLLGWLVLVRVEILAIIPALLLGLVILRGRKWKTWLREAGLILGGVILVFGPWTAARYQDGDSIYKMMLGRGHIIRSSVSEIAAADQVEAEVAGPGKLALFAYHLSNDLRQSVYYLPSGHQPLLTAGNLPDLFFPGQVQDLEGDSFSSKYLERYARTLPYGWREWDGRLAVISILPLAISLALVGWGLGRSRRHLRGLVLFLSLMALAHFSIYSFVGKSGGRFIYIVDWIPLLYYALGVSLLTRELGGRLGLSGSLLEQPEVDRYQAAREVESIQAFWPMIASACLLLAFGIMQPLLPRLIQPVYPDEYNLSNAQDQLAAYGFDLSANQGDLGSTPGLEAVVGKVIYPRFFQAGDHIDYRKGRNPAYSFPRVEFYLVGTYTGWAALPAEQSVEYLPHGSEVIALGLREPEEIADDGSRVHGSYLLVTEMWILPERDQGSAPVQLLCQGSACPGQTDPVE